MKTRGWAGKAVLWMTFRVELRDRSELHKCEIRQKIFGSLILWVLQFFLYLRFFFFFLLLCLKLSTSRYLQHLRPSKASKPILRKPLAIPFTCPPNLISSPEFLPLLGSAFRVVLNWNMSPVWSHTILMVFHTLKRALALWHEMKIQMELLQRLCPQLG